MFRFTCQDIRYRKGMAKWHQGRMRLMTFQPAGAMPEKKGLLGDIGVPDEHELAEGDIGPEHVVPEQQLAHVVEMVAAEQVLAAGAAAEPGGEEDEHAVLGYHRAGEVVHAEHGGEPVGVQGHDPVQGPDGLGQGEEHGRARGQPAQAVGDQGILGWYPAAVLFLKKYHPRNTQTAKAKSDADERRRPDSGSRPFRGSGGRRPAPWRPTR